MVYGALPPETRRQQARLFNEADNDFNLLVASDAVGMGLNLNIRRVVFHTMHKAEGRKRHAVPVSQVKQIAGEAGGSRPSPVLACLCNMSWRRTLGLLCIPHEMS